jgi:hypothetical protein
MIHGTMGKKCSQKSVNVYQSTVIDIAEEPRPQILHIV